MRNPAIISIFFLIFLSCASSGQTDDSYDKEIKAFQHKLNTEFSHKDESPLDSLDLAHFKSLDFFPIRPKYRVVAKFVKNQHPEVFEMSTNTARKPKYIKYGDAYFTLDGKKCHLEIYQNKSLIHNPEYKDYLFVPFGDTTNGTSTYAGGRYIDLRIPKQNDSIVIDFNKAYNPYCAYSHRYSCPLIPYENILPVAIKAGVKKFH